MVWLASRHRHRTKSIEYQGYTGEKLIVGTEHYGRQAVSCNMMAQALPVATAARNAGRILLAVETGISIWLAGAYQIRFNNETKTY